MPSPPFDVKLNTDLTVDEMFIEGSYVHIEQMSDACYWMGIELTGGDLLHVNFWTPRTRIRLNYNWDGHQYEGGEFNVGVRIP